MATNRNPVVRKNDHLTNARAKELAADGVNDAVRRVGKEALANACDKQVRTVEKWMSQASLPGWDDMLNMADVAPEIVRPSMSAKGWVLTPAVSEAANDLALAAGLGHSLTELIERLRDGKRCHVDTAVLAALFRELIPSMQAIVDEDDARRRAA